MRKLYIANDIIEAHLFDSILKNQGLSSLIKNEALQTGVGELPFVETWPEVWIQNLKDWDRALELLADFKQVNTKEDWLCSNCNEANPGTFQTCWLCDTNG